MKNLTTIVIIHIHSVYALLPEDMLRCYTSAWFYKAMCRLESSFWHFVIFNMKTIQTRNDCTAEMMLWTKWWPVHAVYTWLCNSWGNRAQCCSSLIPSSLGLLASLSAVSRCEKSKHGCPYFLHVSDTVIHIHWYHWLSDTLIYKLYI